MDFVVQRRSPLRVLIVRVGAMGDVLHGLPAVVALRRALPDCFIGWAVEPRWGVLLAGAVVDRVHAVRTREWKRRGLGVETMRQVMALGRELRAEGYDVCVDLQGSVRSSVIGWMAGAGRFVGANRPREGVSRVLYGERVELRARHVIAQACELVGAGVGVGLAPVAVEIACDAEAERWFAGLGVEGGFVLLHPGAGWGAKQWPVARYGELAGRLRAAGRRVLLNAGSGVGEGVEAITRAGDATVVACTVAELVALTRRAGVVVGGDTGPVHLAAALGRPVVALFGPTDPARNGPWFPGARVEVLRDGGSVVDHRRHGETEAGLGRIGVDEVLAAVMRMEAAHG